MEVSNTGKGALIGAGGGAGLGAIVGALAGNTAIGAAIGTAVGAGAGAIIGKKMDKAKKEAEAIQNAQVEEVTDANGLDAVKMTFDSGILFNTGKADSLCRFQVFTAAAGYGTEEQQRLRCGYSRLY